MAIAQIFADLLGDPLGGVGGEAIALLVLVFEGGATQADAAFLEAIGSEGPRRLIQEKRLRITVTIRCRLARITRSRARCPARLDALPLLLLWMVRLRMISSSSVRRGSRPAAWSQQVTVSSMELSSAGDVG